MKKVNLRSKFWLLCDFEEDACRLVKIFPLKLTIGNKIFVFNFNDLFSANNSKTEYNGKRLIFWGECYLDDVELNANGHFSFEVNYSMSQGDSTNSLKSKEYSNRPNNFADGILGYNYYITIAHNMEDTEEDVLLHAFRV